VIGRGCAPIFFSIAERVRPRTLGCPRQQRSSPSGGREGGPPEESIEVKKLATAVRASGTGGALCASDLVVVTGSENGIRRVIGEPQLKDDGGSLRDEAKAAGAHVSGPLGAGALTSLLTPIRSLWRRIRGGLRSPLFGL
jgi:hypothetical protein